MMDESEKPTRDVRKDPARIPEGSDEGKKPSTKPSPTVGPEGEHDPVSENDRAVKDGAPGR